MKKMRSWILAASLVFSVPGLLRSADDLTRLNVFPNPVRYFAGETEVVFDNVTSQLRVRIYNVYGTLIREEAVDSGGNSFRWNLKNNSGEDVASGVYIYFVSNNAGEKKFGKIAVIR